MRPLLLFGTSLLVQAAYGRALLVGFRRARRCSTLSEGAPSPDVLPISVVVAARNERDRIPALLEAMARQTHPQFELVVADDHSADGTPERVRAWSRTHPNVRLVGAAPVEPSGKKHALARAIAHARHEHLALTDADCAPPPDWLLTLARHYAAEGRGVEEEKGRRGDEGRTDVRGRADVCRRKVGETDVREKQGVTRGRRTPDVRVFIGYAPYRRGRGLLNKLARYETFVTGFLTAAAAGLGRPYMAVGRNLAYAKGLFEDVGGFGRHAGLLSGDDDLLVQEVARRRVGRVRVLLDAATFVPSDAPTSWRAWLRQKRRHLSDGRAYPLPLQLHLALFHATGTGLWLAPVLAGWRGAGLLAARLLLHGAVLREAAEALGEDDLLPHQPLLELGYALYNGVLAPLSMARELRRW